VIVGLVLAAGLSRRMGRPKLLLPVRGRPVVRLAVEQVRAGGIEAVFVVAGHERNAVEAALEGVDARVVHNAHPERGQGESIRVGIGALPTEADAVLIALGDQPILAADVIPRLRAAFVDTGRPIVAPRYLDGRGNPVLFARTVFPELLALTGDRGARDVVDGDPTRVALIDVPRPMPRDLDTVEDYERFLAWTERGGAA
jgi:molybdenum cofactor cytidylyltransferase